MKSFYEHNREKSGVLFNRGQNHSFPAHYHHNLEFFILRRGRYEVTVNESRFEVTDGSVLAIDSYDIHGYKKLGEGDEEGIVAILPYPCAARFNAKRIGRQISQPLIRDGALCDRLFDFINVHLNTNAPDLLEAGAAFILESIFPYLRFSDEKPKGETDLTRKLLSYIQENFQDDVTRARLARELGYAEAHISRVFKRYLGTSIPEYVNGLRLEYINRQRRAGDKRTTLELLYEAGFNSQRTYYRALSRKGNK